MSRLRWIKSKALYTVGHRGAFLLLLGLAFIAYGLGVAFTDFFNRYPYIFVPWELWAWIWVATGITCLIGAFRFVDRMSFAIASCVSCLWAAKWFYVELHLPSSGTWTTGALWLVIAGIIAIVSTWPEVHIRFTRKDDPCPPSEHTDTEL
jgi:hypothetical protein